MIYRIVFLTILIILSIYDIRKRTIPNSIILPAIIIACVFTGQWLMALMMFIIGAAFFKKEYWCGGDVKLLCLIGAIFGIQAIIIFTLSLVLMEYYRFLRKEEFLPYAPFVLISSLPFFALLRIAVFDQNLFKS